METLPRISMTRTISLSLCAFAVLCGTASAQQARFDDVVRNLRNPDPKVRLSAVRLLRESKYPEAVAPIAALVTDPVDEIQLEAIAAELSFFMVEDVPAKKRGRVRRRGPRRRRCAAAAFELGSARGVAATGAAGAGRRAAPGDRRRHAEGAARSDLHARHDRAAAARRGRRAAA